MKVITCGDGGAIVTNNEKSYERAFGFHDQGHKPNRCGEEIGNRSIIGLNFRMNERSGAVILAQLRKLENILNTLRIKKKKLKDGIKASSIYNSDPGRLGHNYEVRLCAIDRWGREHFSNAIPIIIARFGNDIQSLIDAAPDISRARTQVDVPVVTIPPATYKLSEPLTITKPITLETDGEAEIVISGKPIRLKKGELTIMPANEPHALTAVTRFKMLLTMIRS